MPPGPPDGWEQYRTFLRAYGKRTTSPRYRICTAPSSVGRGGRRGGAEGLPERGWESTAETFGAAGAAECPAVPSPRESCEPAAAGVVPCGSMAPAAARARLHTLRAGKVCAPRRHEAHTQRLSGGDNSYPVSTGHLQNMKRRKPPAPQGPTVTAPGGSPKKAPGPSGAGRPKGTALSRVPLW